jgi:ubiquinone/menaquinone biosynthesis C-methylase UbiE
MLEVAARHRDASGHPDWRLVEADARALPLPDDSADLVVAGWVFGHFRGWMPDGWAREVDLALSEMRRVAKPGAPLVVVETLGTNHETPRRHEALEEYFAHLEQVHGMTRVVLRTDYRFADLASAMALLGRFFGDDMVEAVRARGSAEVPECTGLWSTRL